MRKKSQSSAEQLNLNNVEKYKIANRQRSDILEMVSASFLFLTSDYKTLFVLFLHSVIVLFHALILIGFIILFSALDVILLMAR